MPDDSVSENGETVRAPSPPSFDLRGLKPVEARARAFQSFFKVKPGQKALLLVNSLEVEKEMDKWIGETGHRLLKRVRSENNGASTTTFELIKMEARR